MLEWIAANEDAVQWIFVAAALVYTFLFLYLITRDIR